MESGINITVEGGISPSMPTIRPLEYSVGEICKCFYNEAEKNEHSPQGSIVQTSYKCQGYCRVLDVISKDGDERNSYRVEVFDPIGERIKVLPGCCLRKTKIVPFTKDEAIRHIGAIIHINSKAKEEYMMIVSVSEYDGIVRINDINAKVIAEDFVFASNGHPCAKIVTLKADEAFGADYCRPTNKDA